MNFLGKVLITYGKCNCMEVVVLSQVTWFLFLINTDESGQGKFPKSRKTQKSLSLVLLSLVAFIWKQPQRYSGGGWWNFLFSSWYMTTGCFISLQHLKVISASTWCIVECFEDNLRVSDVVAPSMMKVGCLFVCSDDVLLLVSGAQEAPQPSLDVRFRWF